MSEPGRDPREQDDSISAVAGQTAIGRLINLKLNRRIRPRGRIQTPVKLRRVRQWRQS